MTTFAHVAELLGGKRAVPAEAGVYLLAEDREMSVLLSLSTKLDRTTWALVRYTVPTPLGRGVAHLTWSELVNDPNVTMVSGVPASEMAGPGLWVPALSLPRGTIQELIARFGSIAQAEHSRPSMRCLRVEPPYIVAATPYQVAVEPLPSDLTWLGEPMVLHLPGAALRTIAALAADDADELLLMGRTPTGFACSFGPVTFWSIDPGFFWPAPDTSAERWHEYHIEDPIQETATTVKELRAHVRRSPGDEVSGVRRVEYAAVSFMRSTLLDAGRHLRGNLLLEVPRSAEQPLVFRDAYGATHVIAPLHAA